jgi:dTDP-4-amino-4,6-dideoxygalactose transaminase
MLLYNKYLSKIDEIKVRSFKNWCLPVHWMTTITINKKNLRNKLIYFLYKEGVDARSMINPVHEALHFKKYFNKKNFNNSLQVSKNSLHLPSSTNLKEKQIKFICNKIHQFFKKK